MATPMTAKQTLAQMKKWDVPVRQFPGWEKRGRSRFTAGGAFRPNGIMIHHTGSDTQSLDYVDFLARRGRAGLPAPLCQAATAMSGVVHLTATGKANHAGSGPRNVLNAVIAEVVSLEAEIRPGTATVNGNPHFYGNEVMFDGGQSMTNPQYRNTVLWCCAILDFHGWSARSIIGHKEWSNQKWDPGHTNMAKFRRDVATALKAGPPSQRPKPPTPEPPKTVEVPPAWYAVWLRNLGGFNTEGRKTLAKRIPEIVKDMDSSPWSRGAIHAILELPNPFVEQFDKEMAKIGQVRIVGSDGRYIYAPKALKATVKAKGVFDLQPRLDGDTKQAAWAILRVPALDLPGKVADAMIVVPHLEHESGAAADLVRVRQSNDCFSKAKSVATARGVGEGRILVIGDTNSDTWVRDRSAEPNGFRDTAEMAALTTNTDLHTFTGWGGTPRKGDGIDYGFAKANRLVTYVGVRRANRHLYDHLPLCVVMGWGVKK